MVNCGICPNCGSKLIKKDGRFGAFISCSNFPKCRFSMDYKPENLNLDFNNIDKCPNCGGDLVKKSGRNGDFLSCSNFPRCKFSMDYKQKNIKKANSNSRRKTLYGVKKDGEVPTDGIYIKNNEEENKSQKPMIDFHKDAEKKVISLLKDLNLEKNMESPTAIDLVGEIDGKAIYIEVERDNATTEWTNSVNFPYSLINVPVEKRRHFQKYRYNSFYLKFNRTMDELFIVYGEDILKYSIQRNMSANHSGIRAERTFLRIKKEYAKFSNGNNTKEITSFILDKL